MCDLLVILTETYEMRFLIGKDEGSYGEVRARVDRRSRPTWATRSTIIETASSEADCTRDFVPECESNRASSLKPRNRLNEMRFPASRQDEGNARALASSAEAANGDPLVHKRAELCATRSRCEPKGSQPQV